MSYRLPNAQGVLVPVVREMSLDGKINVIFESDGPSKTRITVNTRYVVQRRFTSMSTDTVAFNSASGAMFANRGTAKPLECRANGEMEAEVLRTILGL